MIDLLAFEPHFLDHSAPVWHALPKSARGRVLVDPDLLPRARKLGLEAIGAVAPKPSSRYFPEPSGLPALVASYGDMKKGRRMGYGPFVFLEHGIGQSYGGDRTQANHASYSGGQDRDDVALFLVPGPNPAARWRQAYPQTPVAIVGCPKLDSLPQRDGGGGPTVAVSFHFPVNIVPETRPVFEHYARVLPDLAKRFNVIGHGHPRFYGIDRKWRRQRIEYVRDFDDVCRRADVYVCDNSSTLYEFAATGRPVVVLNGPGYRRHVDHGLRFWGAANVGIQVDRPDQLVGAVEEALLDPPARKRAREKALGLVYAHRTGAAERAAEAITDWLAGDQEVAA